MQCAIMELNTQSMDHTQVYTELWSCSSGLMNQGDKPVENLTGNTGVQGMIHGPATYFLFLLYLVQLAFPWNGR